MEKEKDLEVVVTERYGEECLDDAVVSDKTQGAGRPQGFVEVFEVDENGNKKLIGKNNLVLYQGREMLAQRLVNTENASATPTKDEFVAWFGLGSGGVDPADPFDPVSPVVTDTELASLVMINASDSSNADYQTAGGIYPDTGYYKKPFDTIEFEADVLNDNKWLILKITTTIGTTDANDENLSEAGLYSAASSGGGYSGQFSLFARVTFPTIRKVSTRRISFVWYLFV